MRVLGVSTFGHDNSAFLVDTDRQEIIALSLERVTRIKHDNGDIAPIRDAYPNLFQNLNCICLGAEGADGDTTKIGRGLYYGLKNKLLAYRVIRPTYIKGVVEFSRLSRLKRWQKLGLRAGAMFYWNSLLCRIFKEDEDRGFFARGYAKAFGVNENQVRFFDHHLCHAASAYYFSPFLKTEKITSITLDGYGDGYFSKIFSCYQGKMHFLGGSKTRTCPEATVADKVISIGTLYSNFVEAMDLTRNSDEGKVEALAAYGSWDNDLFKKLWASVEIRNTYEIHFTQAVEKFYDLNFLRAERQKLGDKDFCSVIQEFLNRLIGKFVQGILLKQGTEKICLSGGVAANVIMNMHIFQTGEAKDVFVFPAMGDDGVSAGAAVLQLVDSGEDVAWLKSKTMPYWGPTIGTEQEILSALNSFSGEVKFLKNINWHMDVAKRLYSNQVGALVQGGMEYGPRALGNRSIIASPLGSETRDRINSSVKRRPWYQPFCPSILAEERNRLFVNSLPNKHMTFAFTMKEEYAKKIPSAVHIDRTARPQFVEEADNPNYFLLLKEFKELSGFGVLINTSFNLHGRTIVRTPTDAIRDFIDCNLDFLILENYIVERCNSQ